MKTLLRTRRRDRTRRAPTVVVRQHEEPTASAVDNSAPLQPQSLNWKWWEWSDQDQLAFALGLVAAAMILLPCILGALTAPTPAK